MAIDWSKKEEQKKFWHSSAHLIAVAIMELYPNTKTTIGPVFEVCLCLK